MPQSLFQLTLLVDEYDRAIDYYVNVLGFVLLEDTVLSPEKRWVRVAPEGNTGAALLLARAVTTEQERAIGCQTGGRVFLFLHTDDIDRDVSVYKSRGVRFLREPEPADFGTAAVFEDLYGNKWDLIAPRQQQSYARR